MIVRVNFEGDVSMMFGTSYKLWTVQFDEFCWRFKKQLGEITLVETADDKWVGWGGLKWCSEEEFQQQLNREGCQSNDPDNPNPRNYSGMRFFLDGEIDRIARRILEDCKNNRTDADLVYKGKLPKGV